MKDRLLRLYDCFLTHRRWLWTGFAALCLILVALAATLRYNEDIMDFLPVTPEERAALEAYQSQQSASRLVLIIEGDDELRRSDAFYDLDERLAEAGHPLSEFDLSDLINSRWLIANSQSPITNSRLDSLFTPEAVRAALERDKRILSTPGGSAFAPLIQSDPLGLIPISNFQSSISNAKQSFAYIETPYGSTETKQNAALIDSLNAITNEVAVAYPDLNIRWIGAPLIAVGNARRIKTDTLLCIALSLVLILILLAYAFPRRRDLWLILLAVSFGWLTGMAVLRLFTPAVSAIVLGIGSVLIGIAVNYPLHLLVHQRYTTSVRQTLDEVLSPLVVGNITTVGAFLTLVPLQATAMRHLGIFASAMLVGTILFCIFVMPHLMSAEPTPLREIKLKKATHSPKLKAGLPWVVLILTLIFGGYLIVNRHSSNRQFFDSNLTHINYMTSQQRADMEQLAKVYANTQANTNADQWSSYWQSHDAPALVSLIQAEAQRAGFRPDAFQPFYDYLLNPNPQTANTFSFNNLAERLSENFDYIGLCCSLIVFVFLFLTFALRPPSDPLPSANHIFVNRPIVNGLVLALIAFIPMALSWVWILAIMHLFGIQFNIVNIILATFIFGQGDDYTIFIVEGLLYEHRTGKPMLPQYRQSIILSALIMLLGIGILVLAVHPAMHSLGTVTLIGMTIVLLMAFTVPPLLFRLYIRFCKSR